MNKILKKTIIILSAVIGLSMLPAFTQPVYAGLDGNGVGSSRTTGSNMSGGPSMHKTGFLLSCGSAPNDSTPQTPMGKACLLDQFGGSCNALQASLNTNRNAIVFELNDKYIEKAVKRFEMKKYY